MRLLVFAVRVDDFAHPTMLRRPCHQLTPALLSLLGELLDPRLRLLLARLRTGSDRGGATGTGARSGCIRRHSRVHLHTGREALLVALRGLLLLLVTLRDAGLRLRVLLLLLTVGVRDCVHTDDKLMHVVLGGTDVEEPVRGHAAQESVERTSAARNRLQTSGRVLRLATRLLIRRTGARRDVGRLRGDARLSLLTALLLPDQVLLHTGRIARQPSRLLRRFELESTRRLRTLPQLLRALAEALDLVIHLIDVLKGRWRIWELDVARAVTRHFRFAAFAAFFADS